MEAVVRTYHWNQGHKKERRRRLPLPSMTTPRPLPMEEALRSQHRNQGRKKERRRRQPLPLTTQAKVLAMKFNYQRNLCFELCCKEVYVLIQYFVNLCVPKLYVGCPPLLFATYLFVRSRPIYEPGCWISHINGGAKLLGTFWCFWYRMIWVSIRRDCETSVQRLCWST